MEFTDDEDDHLEEEEDDDDEGITIPTPNPNPNPPTTASTLIRNGASSGGGGGQIPTTVRYRECQKNHAVSLGGHAVDGCGEFMPAGEEGSLDALKCAACGCHRNFHRKESDISSSPDLAAGPTSSSAPAMHHTQLFAPSYYRTPVPPPHQQGHHGYVHHTHGGLHGYPHHRPLALPSSSGGRGTEEMEEFSNPSSSGGGGGSGNRKNKRFRTKFTPEQKERMAEFAERIGWRIQKQDEAAVQQFCQEVNVTRQVLKVWLHNNKHSLARKP